MHPEIMRQHNTQPNGGQPAASVRKYSGSQRAQTRAPMTTEYQERFLPPHCHTAVVTTSAQKDPYHPLKATGGDMTTFRSYCVTNKWIKIPPKPPQPSLPPKGHRRCSSAPHNPVHFVANQIASKLEDYTSVYKNDFRAWKANKRQPYKLNDSLKVNQGLVVTDSASKEGRSQKNPVLGAANCKPVPQVREPQPFESTTSYRSDYVTHPVQPRPRREKPVYQTSHDLLSEPAVFSKPKVTWDLNQELFDGASELFQEFKTWSLETKFRGQGKAKESSPAADRDKFLSTSHQCQRKKPVLPSIQRSEKSKEPFQSTTTMKEDYKAWETPRRFPTAHKEELDRPRKTTFSVCTHKPADSCKTNPKPVSLQPKLKETAVCDDIQKPQCPAEKGAFSGFEYISTGTEESGRYWTTSLDRGATWPDGNIREEPNQAQQIIRCMVSSRN